MKDAVKNKKILPLLLLIFLCSFFPLKAVYASTFTDSFSSAWSFVNKNIVGQVKKDFCRQYILAISTGEWKQGEFRTNLGRKTCTSYSVPTNTSEKISETNLQNINGNSALTDLGNVSVINNPTPEVFTPDISSKNSVLDTEMILNLTNVARKDTDISLGYLRENKILDSIAIIRVRDMFDKQYFEHNSPIGDNASKEAKANGYGYITIGENIALGNFDGTQGLIDSWMKSPGHRANILNKNYTEIGVSALSGNYKGQKVWIAAQIFGKPIGDCKEPDADMKDKISKYKVSADSIMTSINKIDLDLKSISQSDTQTYNTKVAERNTLAGLYNNLASEIKTLVAEYNKQASIFNDCIKIQ